MDVWADLASVAEDEELEVLDMETICENADSDSDPQQEAIDVAKLERSRFPLQAGDSQYLISMRCAAKPIFRSFFNRHYIGCIFSTRHR